MASIRHGLDAVKERLALLVDEPMIHEACERAGHQWRHRRWGPVLTVQALITQVLHGNTAIAHLRHLLDFEFADSAYCSARCRLPLDVLRVLVEAVTAKFDAITEPRTWCGHRVWLLDGSSFSMPDVPALRRRFGQPPSQAPGCGFPVASLMVLCDWGTGLIRQAEALAMTVHDMSQAVAMHSALGIGDVLVGDRGFCSYAHLGLCKQRGIEGVFRMHQRVRVSFRPGRKSRQELPRSKAKGAPNSRWIRKLGPEDQIVEWPKPSQKPPWMTQEQYDQLPETLQLRELRYRVGQRGFRTREVLLLTTLLDAAAYPREALADLYHQRWQIETNIKDLKITMGLHQLKCQSVDGVMKELYAYVVAYNLVRYVILEAAQRQGVHPRRISFVDALRWLIDGAAADEVPELRVNPARSGRWEPRVIKRRSKPYSWMTKPRREQKNRPPANANARKGPK